MSYKEATFLTDKESDYEILYLNGKYIDDYGVMGETPDDPVNQEAGYIAHLSHLDRAFRLPERQGQERKIKCLR